MDDWMTMALEMEKNTPVAAPVAAPEVPKAAPVASTLPSVLGIEKGKLGVVVSMTKKEILVQTTERVSCTVHSCLNQHMDSIKVGSKVLVEAHTSKVSLGLDTHISNTTGANKVARKVGFRIMAVVPENYTEKVEEKMPVLDNALDWLLEAPAAAGGM